MNEFERNLLFASQDIEISITPEEFFNSLFNEFDYNNNNLKTMNTSKLVRAIKYVISMKPKLFDTSGFDKKLFEFFIKMNWNQAKNWDKIVDIVYYILTKFDMERENFLFYMFYDPKNNLELSKIINQSHPPKLYRPFNKTVLYNVTGDVKWLSQEAKDLFLF